MKIKHLVLGGMLAISLAGAANPVIVKMNAVSKTMTLVEKESGNPVAVPDPTGQEYSLELDPGKYVLSAYGTDGETLNGTIVLNVTDSVTTQQFTVLTCTAYVSNKDADGNPWNVENGDYRLNVSVNTREGVTTEQTPGKSITKNRYTFLALNGNSYNVAFEPSEAHQAEGYMTLYRGGTLTANVNVTGAIPTGGDFNITVPAEAELQLGMKFTHFTDFTPIEPKSVENSDAGKTYNYTLANGQVYNYRSWKPGGLTHGGYFTMNTADASKCPQICFTEDDYSKADPKAINHSPQSNNGYETGDILLNINPQHHLKMSVGEEFLVHGMRMWEISDNSTNNYFFEPDFHYAILDSGFQPSTEVIEIGNCLENNTSAWSKIVAKSKGTAIVLVTYDGINLNYYNNADKKEYLGGELWGAIWPENTGVFVVTVDEDDSSVVPNMTVNEEYNMDALRLAGNNVDAEHDVFYYLDDREGFEFTFTPENVASVEMAVPSITETEASYSGFTSEGITANGDGSYTLLLKEGKTIVRMTDAAGRSAYQVLRAKPCHREITNETRPGSTIFQPGDKVKIQYSGLFHPANKIAGIYNMSAYVTYNGVPNGSSLILGSGQYTFGSAPSAQAVTVEIPDTLDANETPVLVMNEGVIQVNGFGDPIGNHRNTSPTAGRSPNFTAVPHKTYFGSIPDINLCLTPYRAFPIVLDITPENAEVELTFSGNPILPDEEGHYSGTYGTYELTANAEGFRCFRSSYEIPDGAEGTVTFNVVMEELGDAWDGKAKTEPEADENGIFLIGTPAELAWFADHVNAKGADQNAVLLSDLHLGNFDWTPIGSASSSAYTGTFDGGGHTVAGLYINNAKGSNQGLFGYVKDAAISGLEVYGSVSGKQYVGGVAGYVAGSSSLDRCANHASVTGASTYVGGVIGYLSSATATASNLYNTGTISGTTNCGGVIGCNNKDALVSNIFNVGMVKGNGVGSCIGGTTAKENVSNAFAITEYNVTAGQTLVTEEQMASGEIAYRLGEAFFQTIGEDPYPKFEGMKVYYDDETDEYYNIVKASELKLDVREATLDINNNPTLVLTAGYGPAHSEAPQVVWSSGDERVVLVEPDGEYTATVTAVGDGKATVRVELADNPEVYDICTVSVGGDTTTVESIFGEGDVEKVDVFDLNGRVVRLGASMRYCRSLAPGIYIIRYNGKAKQVVVR